MCGCVCVWLCVCASVYVCVLCVCVCVCVSVCPILMGRFLQLGHTHVGTCLRLVVLGSMRLACPLKIRSSSFEESS